MNKKITLMAIISFCIAGISACSDNKVSFSRDVHPILKKECMECHAKGEKGEQKSGLSMETYAELMTGTKFGPVIEPGSSVSSTLVRLIDHKADSSINMPHDKNQIPAAEIDLIKKWIDQGARNN